MLLSKEEPAVIWLSKGTQEIILYYRKLYSSIKHLFKTTEVKTQKELIVIFTDLKEWLQAR